MVTKKSYVHGGRHTSVPTKELRFAGMVSGLSMGVSLKLRECRGRLNNFKARNTADPMHGVVNSVGESSKLMGREIPWTKNK